MTSVLVTGSSSGLGKLTVEKLLKEGFHVFATMLDSELKKSEVVNSFNNIHESSPGKLHLLALDVTSQDSVDEAISEAEKISGGLDVLINNAGIGGTGWTEAFPEDQVSKIFDVNLFGVQRMTRGVLPSMRKREKGLIINLSSIQGRVVFPYSGIYTASKFAVEGLSESYHYELYSLGIEVVILQPGGFKTNFESVQGGPNDKECLKTYGALEARPHRVWGEPGEKKDFLPDPQPVPDAIVELIRMPGGTRPLRTVVDPLLGGDEPKSINNTCQSAQVSLSKKLKWDELKHLT